MPDETKTEQLQPGQGALALGASHAENAGFGEERDLGVGLEIEIVI